MIHNSSELLKRYKQKVTPARVQILDILLGVHKPQTVEMILHGIKDKTINETTVYRTIDTFLFLGIIKRVDLRQGAAYYEIDHHHHHIVCTSCGVIEDFESCEIEKTSKKILAKSKKFKKIEDHSFELFGVCLSCSKKYV